MPFALIIAVPLAALLLWALYAEQPPPEPAPAQRAAWAGVPTRAQVTRVDFPRTVWGYDTDAVDAHLARIADSMALRSDTGTTEDREAQVADGVPVVSAAVEMDPAGAQRDPADPTTGGEESTIPTADEQG